MQENIRIAKNEGENVLVQSKIFFMDLRKSSCQQFNCGIGDWQIKIMESSQSSSAIRRDPACHLETEMSGVILWAFAGSRFADPGDPGDRVSDCDARLAAS